MASKKTTERVGAIDPDLIALAQPIDKMQPDSKNARVHERKSIEALKYLLTRFGQKRAIVVCKKTGIVTAGNGIFTAAKELGWTHLAANMVAFKNEGERVAYGLSDNQSAELSSFEDSVLLGLLKEINESGEEFNAGAIGWTDGILASIAKSLGPPTPPVTFKTIEPDMKADHRCPQCGYEWNGAAAAGGSENGA